MVEGMQEPMTRFGGLYIWLTIFALFATTFSWINKIDTELVALYGMDTVKTFLYNGYVDTVTLGLPQWAFSCLCTFIVAGAMGLIAAESWKIDYDSKDELPSSRNIIKEANLFRDNSKADWDESDLDDHEEQLKLELDKISNSLGPEQRAKMIQLQKIGLKEVDDEEDDSDDKETPNSWGV